MFAIGAETHDDGVPAVAGVPAVDCVLAAAGVPAIAGDLLLLASLLLMASCCCRHYNYCFHVVAFVPAGFAFMTSLSYLTTLLVSCCCCRHCCQCLSYRCKCSCSVVDSATMTSSLSYKIRRKIREFLQNFLWGGRGGGGVAKSSAYLARKLILQTFYKLDSKGNVCLVD
jgi:hypothetical protein